MSLFRIHTAKITVETDCLELYNACLYSGVIEKDRGHYLRVKYIEVLKTDGTYGVKYPKN